MSSEPLIAVFVDFENLAIGAREMRGGDFQIRLVLKRLLEKGRIVFKRAYCDWRNYADAVRDFHSQGIELIDIPQTKMSGKNSADIRMVVDALDLCYSKQHIDVFALVSGDSDFSPLVSKLKENNKRVLGCGIKSSTSNLLIANCDEFIYYDDLVRVASKSRAAQSRAAQSQTPSAPATSAASERGATERPAKKEPPKRPKKQQAVDQLLEVLQSVEQDYDIVWGSALKQAVRRVFPGFNEGYYDYANFSELLEDMAADGLIDIDYDASRGNYQVRSRLR
ncbi:NYN domain-containing protein [Candidatus Laterigemmans baculatus]|uniref:NYN domain-containing protein n=1 Tax=Candidatus Laterigemmans baculatus TaxID=2770505 RepID=UPI0013DB7E0F|nr:NYN domain-containing protein [Candidatus Laterigemmans baculatus]